MSQKDDLEKAKYLIKEDKVARIKHPNLELQDHFVVTGTKDDYLVILPSYCTCTHFHITCIREKEKVCKHILAVRIIGNEARELEIENWQNLLFRKR